jgi:hypothetical protein
LGGELIGAMPGKQAASGDSDRDKIVESPAAFGDLPQIADPPYRAALFAASSVLAISMAMVILPTPPGTGVIAPATSAASA